MVKLVNRAKETTSTTGTGTLTLDGAAGSYQSFAAAGVTNGDTISYVIEDGNDWEIGSGVYSDVGSITLTRTVTESSDGGTALNLTGNAQVFATILAGNILQPEDDIAWTGEQTWTATNTSWVKIDGSTGWMTIDENNRLQFGANTSIPDAHMFTTGSGFGILTNNGDMNLNQTGSFSAGTHGDVNIRARNSADNGLATYFKAEGASGSAKIMYDGSEVIATVSGGITLTGTLNSHTIPAGSGTFALLSDINYPPETNDLSSVVTWDIVPDAYVSNTSVTQHQTDLRITESQITDLQTYATQAALNTAVTNSSNWDTAYSWGDHGVEGYSTITYVNTKTANSANWDTAYSWGNHASQGYATTTALNTAVTNSSNWDTAYSWGDHGVEGYATTSYVDTAVAGVVDSAPAALNTLNELAAALGDDANFATTTATNIGTKLAKASNLSDLTNAATARTNLGLGTAATTASTDYATAAQGTKADTAHGWGDHAQVGYLTSQTSHADVVVDGDFGSQGLMKRGASAGSYSIVTDNSANWNTAYSWGDHSTQGYLTSYTDTNNYASSLSFNTTNGILTVNRSGLTALTVDLDGRYLTSQTSHADVVVDGDFTSQGLMKRGATAGSYSIVTDNSANWNTAYGWGDHSAAGYLTSESFTSLVQDTTPQLGGALDTNGNQINFGDSNGSTTNMLTFGASNDLKIYHFGNTYIENINWDLTIRNSANDYDVKIQTDNGSGGIANYFVADGSTGAAEMHWGDYSTNGGADGGVKLATNASGVTITGTATATAFSGDGSGLTNLSAISNVVEDTTPQLGGDLDSNNKHIRMGDYDYIYFGAGSDMEIAHESNYGGNNVIRSLNESLYIQAQDLFIQNASSQEIIKASSTGQAIISHAGSWRLLTQSDRTDVVNGYLNFGGNVDATFSDTSSINMGAGGLVNILGTNTQCPDLEIQHLNSSGYIRSWHGDLVLWAAGVGASHDVRILGSRSDNSYGGSEYFKADGSSGEAQLFHYGTQRFATKSTGIELKTTTGSAGAVTVTNGTDTLQINTDVAGYQVISSTGEMQVSMGDWTITSVSGELIFSHSGSNKMKIDSNGNLTVTGNVTGYGTV